MTMTAGRRRAADAAGSPRVLLLVMSLLLMGGAVLPRGSLAARVATGLKAADAPPPLAATATSAKDDFDFFFLVR